MKFNIICALLLSSSALAASADEVDLTTDQIKVILEGNSIFGVHYEQKTVQYFSRSGLTLWMKDGDEAPVEGAWKSENNQYCSDFGSGWGCYRVVNDLDQGIHYFLKEGFRAPFVIHSGFDIGL